MGGRALYLGSVEVFRLFSFSRFKMQIEFETILAVFTEDRAVIRQDFSSQARQIMRFVLWGAFGGFVFLTAIGNIPFAVFWLVFLLGTWWFIRRHSDHIREVIIDKTMGQMTCFETKSGRESQEQYDLSQFTKVVLLWGYKRPNFKKYHRYRLCLQRSVSEAEIDSALPEHLKKAADQSDFAAKLLRGTAQGAGIHYVEITIDALRSERHVRALSDSVVTLLAPEYQLVAEDTFAPSKFSQISR